MFAIWAITGTCGKADTAVGLRLALNAPLGARGPSHSRWSKKKSSDCLEASCDTFRSLTGDNIMKFLNIQILIHHITLLILKLTRTTMDNSSGAHVKRVIGGPINAAWCLRPTCFTAQNFLSLLGYQRSRRNITGRGIEHQLHS